MCVCVYICKYIHTHTHTYMHTYIHVHTNRDYAQVIAKNMKSDCSHIFVL